MKTLRARLVLPLSAPPVEDGAIRVADGRIAEVGRWKDLCAPDAEDLGDVLLMPGLINAHCHLDYTAMRGKISAQENFPEWIARINELKREFSDEDYLSSIRQGFTELRKWGTTTVFNIESFPALLEAMPPPPLRTWWFYEMLDIRQRVSPEEIVANARAFFRNHPEWKGGFGLSPHAPFTASSELYARSKSLAEQEGIPWTTHLAETDEELQMFRHSSGLLYDFLKGFGRPMADTGGLTPLASRDLPKHGILAHMNCLEDSDYELLASSGKDWAIVHCPKCHAYFGRAPFNWKRLDRPLCLGTDSLASNTSLNLFEEMRAFQAGSPEASAAAILDMVTRNPAKAIGLEGRLGEITVGAYADLISVPYVGDAKDAYAGVLENASPIEWLMVEGVPL